MQKYEQVEIIGKGSFGIVKKVRRLSDSRMLVWKEMRYGSMNSRQKQQLVTEVNLLKSLNHPNIVKYYDRIVNKKDSTVYIIMQYCAGGDLSSLLKSSKKTENYLPEEAIWKIFYQLVQALDYCHSRGEGDRKVIHRDIKPANIFMDEHDNIKLGDFGLSREMGEYSLFAETHVGTPYYMSPEQVKDAKYNEKSDIWSAGCMLYQMASLRRPFEANTPLALAKKIQQGKYDRIPFRYSENLFDLIRSMLMVDPQKRISAAEILKLPPFAIRVKEAQLKCRLEELRKREAAVKLLQSELLREKSEEVLLKPLGSKMKECDIDDKENMRDTSNVGY